MLISCAAGVSIREYREAAEESPLLEARTFLFFGSSGHGSPSVHHHSCCVRTDVQELLARFGKGREEDGMGWKRRWGCLVPEGVKGGKLGFCYSSKPWLCFTTPGGVASLCCVVPRALGVFFRGGLQRGSEPAEARQVAALFLCGLGSIVACVLHRFGDAPLDRCGGDHFIEQRSCGLERFVVVL